MHYVSCVFIQGDHYAGVTLERSGFSASIRTLIHWSAYNGYNMITIWWDDSFYSPWGSYVLQFNPELFPSPAIPDIYFTCNSGCVTCKHLLLAPVKLTVKNNILLLFWVFSIAHCIKSLLWQKKKEACMSAAVRYCFPLCFVCRRLTLFLFARLLTFDCFWMPFLLEEFCSACTAADTSPLYLRLSVLRSCNCNHVKFCIICVLYFWFLIKGPPIGLIARVHLLFKVS